jgi:outer membrane immunogenic protein
MMRFETAILLASALGFGAAQAASAADMPFKGPVYKAPAAVVAVNWTGIYVGVNAGYGRQRGDAVEFSTDSIIPVNFGDSTAPSRGTIGDIGARGWFGGGQIGFNHQFAPHWVAGIEADIQHSEIDDGVAGLFTNPNGTFPIAGAASLRLKWFGTVRGRIGVTPLPNWLIYATGGFAYGQVDYGVVAREVPPGALFQAELNAQNKTGYAVGGGVEHRVLPNLSWKAEYQYIDLGTLSATAPVVLIGLGLPTGEIATLGSVRAAFHTVRLGVNYRFGAVPPPVP